jgi:hypothetical protein
MGAIDVPRTGRAVAANLQIVSGKPWASTSPRDVRRQANLGR